MWQKVLSFVPCPIGLENFDSFLKEFLYHGYIFFDNLKEDHANYLCTKSWRYQRSVEKDSKLLADHKKILRKA